MAESFKGKFLIAAPSLTDPNFARSVILILQYDQSGTLGVIINRALDVTIRRACEQVLETDCNIEGFLYQGGPCEAVLMVLHDQAMHDDEPVLPGVYFSTEKAVVEEVIAAGPESVKFIVGYAGWGAGQLEDELASGSWIVMPATAARVFGPIERIWDRLVTEFGLQNWILPEQIPEDPTMN